jgi:hypothetical protein
MARGPRQQTLGCMFAIVGLAAEVVGMAWGWMSGRRRFR